PGGVVMTPVPSPISTSRLKVTVLDVSNPKSPQITQETYIDGDYQDSRVVHDQLYLVLRNFLTRLPAPMISASGTVFQYETEDQYRARLGAADLKTLLPQVLHPDYNRVNQSWALASADSTYKPGQPADTTLVSVVAFDVTKTNWDNPVSS